MFIDSYPPYNYELFFNLISWTICLQYIKLYQFLVYPQLSVFQKMFKNVRLHVFVSCSKINLLNKYTLQNVWHRLVNYLKNKLVWKCQKISSPPLHEVVWTFIASQKTNAKYRKHNSHVSYFLLSITFNIGMTPSADESPFNEVVVIINFISYTLHTNTCTNVHVFVLRLFFNLI
jgi:hypothetical protein